MKMLKIESGKSQLCSGTKYGRVRADNFHCHRRISRGNFVRFGDFLVDFATFLLWTWSRKCYFFIISRLLLKLELRRQWEESLFISNLWKSQFCQYTTLPGIFHRSWKWKMPTLRRVRGGRTHIGLILSWRVRINHRRHSRRHPRMAGNLLKAVYLLRRL